MKCRSRIVEAYGSLLNPEERKETLEKNGRTKQKGIMKELGKVKRRGWKLSFDRYSEKKGYAVLNLVYTANQDDVYYTTVYEVNDVAYWEIMKREMGKQTAKRWKHGRLVDTNSYRPIQLNSEFGITDIFIIPYHGRQRSQTHSETEYVKKVRKGIEESYKDMSKQKKQKVTFKRVCHNCKRVFETSSFKEHYCSEECKESYLKKERERTRKRREKQQKGSYAHGRIWVLDEETWTWKLEIRP